LLILIVSVGCAEGFGAEVVIKQPLGEKPGENSGTGKPKDAGADKGSTGATEAKVPCAMGDTADCSCETPGSMGTKYCMFDATSPTKGSFSECQDCVDPPMRVDSGSDPGDISLIDSGVGMGSGGTGSGGTAATGGTKAPPPPPPPPPTPKIPCPSLCVQPCVPFGILACCRDNGTCGCTWAPGAYCL
jgi:hypothetical protein